MISFPRCRFAVMSWCHRRWFQYWFMQATRANSTLSGKCASGLKLQLQHCHELNGARHNSSGSDSPLVQRLDKRGLLRVGGPDATLFLQGLLTNDVEVLADRGGSMYALMLNVQGRVVFDLLLYKLDDKDDKTSSVFLVECEQQQLEELQKTISRYRLRKKVDIAMVNDSYSVWATMPSVLPTSAANITPVTPADQAGHLLCVLDPRLPALGSRLVLPKDLSGTDVIAGAVEAPTPDFYTTRRYLLGVGEGTDDLPPGNLLPLECNAVFLNGVSFNKGCYIGQELTARSHHTGVIRKRLMPVSFTSENHEAKSGDTVENAAGKNCGKLRHCVGQIGLALLRVAEVLGSSLPLVTIGEEKRKTGELEATIPFWWPKDSDPVIKQALDQRAVRQTAS